MHFLVITFPFVCPSFHLETGRVSRESDPSNRSDPLLPGIFGIEFSPVFSRAATTMDDKRRATGREGKEERREVVSVGGENSQELCWKPGRDCCIEVASARSRSVARRQERAGCKVQSRFVGVSRLPRSPMRARIRARFGTRTRGYIHAFQRVFAYIIFRGG